MLKFFNAEENLEVLINELEARRQAEDKKVTEAVEEILKEVRENGDDALLSLKIYR